MDRRREELIAAALELFGRHDAEDVSIDDVAASAGASRALVYHYFGGKQELYVAALRSAAAELRARLQPQGEGGPLEQLSSGLTRYFDFVEEHAAGYAALLRGGRPTAPERSARSSTRCGSACCAWSSIRWGSTRPVRRCASR
ncbi:hypothetical protein GCM10027612_00630 [Microbispora bryophytorum subsp. camponoti]